MVATPVIATPTPLAPTTVPGPAPVAAPGPTPAPPPVARPTPAAVAPSAAPVAPAAAAAAAPTIPATPVTPAAHPAPVAAVKLEPVVPTPAAPPKSKKKKKPQEKKEDDKEEGKGKDKDKEEKDASGAASGSAQPGGLLPMGRGQGIDLRAEEEAQRRAFRSAVGNTKFAGNASRARHTDLFGEPKLRKRLNEIGECLTTRANGVPALTTASAEKHGMAFDDEAMRYLALAAEIRVRSLVSSAVRAQHHRVASTHQHKPPMSKGSSSKPAQPLWSQKITSDPHAVMAALANANREENKAHRVARTERNARETEIARAEAARDRERDRDGGSQSNEPAAATTSGGPASESDGPSPSPSATKPKEPTFQAAPTFGQPPPTKKGGKSKKAATRDVSADMQQKMMNATALLQAGGRKRYAWETGAMSGAFKPQVPSLLSGKRKKGAGKDDEQAGGAAGGQDGAAGGSGKGGAGAGAGAAGADWADADMAPRPPKRPKRAVTGPHRRPVDLETPGDKKGRDDTALTAVDMLFALEHEGSGRGMGTADEIVARVNARPGGPYGRW